MTARCTICDNYLFFSDKEMEDNPKPKCSCGGAIDIMVSSGSLSGEHPHYPAKTFFTDITAEPYFYAYKNSKGKYFVYLNDKMVAVKNPKLFTRPARKL